nr:DUF4412 domain-containing protein [uncultured Carboxylicivirga sp.]
MKKYLVAGIVVMAAFVVQNIQAQSFLEKMAKKAAEKVEKKSEQKTEEQMDKKLDQMFEEAFESEESDSAEEVDPSATWAEKLAGMGYAGDPVNIEDTYTFSSSITMHMTSVDENGQSSSGDVKIYTNTNQQTFAYEFTSDQSQINDDTEVGLMIMDAKNKANIILNDDDKTGIVYGVDGAIDESILGEDSDDEDMPENIDYADPRISKTGNTKTICGYKCDEYTYKDEESTGLLYLTKEIDWDSENFMTTIFKSAMYSHGILNGFLMASEDTDLSTGEKSTYEVTQINSNDKSSFSMSDYKITNMGSFSMPEGTYDEE